MLVAEMGLALSPVGAAAGGGLEYHATSGIDAVIYPAEYLRARTESDGGRGTIALDDGTYLSVVTDINDPLIQNRGDGEFHPFTADHVISILEEISYPGVALDVEIYLLPYPRTNVLVSSASGTRIFLSPQVLDVQVESCAYIVAHEIGHVFQYAYLPERATRRWHIYRKLRGITDTNRYSVSSAHADQPKEIFAEDFRVLFGGPNAFFGGQVENTGLTSPLYVTGLRDFFMSVQTPEVDEPSILAVANYPNPFNPQTQIRVDVSQTLLDRGDALTIRIYDVRGALVREVYAGRPDGPEVRVTWDGRNQHGRTVASATYFGVVRVGEEKLTQKLLMIK